MIDRIALGYVVDFIDISPLFDFAVFNVADCCVTVGAVIMAVYVLFFFDEKKLHSVLAVSDGHSADAISAEETAPDNASADSTAPEEAADE